MDLHNYFDFFFYKFYKIFQQLAIEMECQCFIFLNLLIKLELIINLNESIRVKFFPQWFSPQQFVKSAWSKVAYPFPQIAFKGSIYVVHISGLVNKLLHSEVFILGQIFVPRNFYSSLKNFKMKKLIIANQLNYFSHIF